MNTLHVLPIVVTIQQSSRPTRTRAQRHVAECRISCTRDSVAAILLCGEIRLGIESGSNLATATERLARVQQAHRPGRPEQQNTRLDWTIDLERAIRSMPEHLQDVLQARFVDELDRYQTAKRLHLSMRQVTLREHEATAMATRLLVDRGIIPCTASHYTNMTEPAQNGTGSKAVHRRHCRQPKRGRQ